MTVNGLEEETAKLKGLWKIAKNAGWFLPHENICWVSERHNELHRNAQGQLHNVKGMALKYPDGWGIYALNGVRFPQELYWKVVEGNMPFKEILKIVNIDQRTQAMRFGDVRQFLAHTKAKLLNKSPRGNELYQIPHGDIFTKDAFYLIYTCPSTGRLYMSGVPEEIAKDKSADSAMAWKHYLSLDAYQAMKPLMHES